MESKRYRLRSATELIGEYSHTSEKEVRRALRRSGPLLAGLTCTDSLQTSFDTPGALYNGTGEVELRDEDGNKDKDVGHMILLAGYGTKTSFKRKKGKRKYKIEKYFIYQTSWGPKSGGEGDGSGRIELRALSNVIKLAVNCPHVKLGWRRVLRGRQRV
ncbi:unnamed protein product [Cuscuta epithymum]|uniref:Peptidase C1A papain C-terminal domain-containing protein n=1 Tax=Cuscuta epithymum TaxID=186058 RepID=A0AAV0FE56_9ASTE|nr:unnamed protein product [Cuscuta epithymum]